jgi:hypothetical protein
VNLSSVKFQSPCLSTGCHTAIKEQEGVHKLHYEQPTRFQGCIRALKHLKAIFKGVHVLHRAQQYCCKVHLLAFLHAILNLSLCLALSHEKIHLAIDIFGRFFGFLL